MLLPTTTFLTLIALLVPSVFAQVPASLSKGFDTQIQVNFKGDSALGFKDGEKIPFSDTANQPVFALGDASGVNRAISFMIMMIDTTKENNFIMHYLQTDFKATGDKTGLSASSTPMVPYAKPGSLGESGERKYTFLLYQQKGSSDMDSMPKAGEKFDYKSFNTANSLEPPIAGIAMTVEVEGASSSDKSSEQSSKAAEGVSSTTSTRITTTTTKTEPTSTSSSTSLPKTISGSDGLTMKKPEPKLIGGGIVSEQPFPPNTASGPTTASSGNGLTTKKPPLKSVGGGVVSEQPFPENATVGPIVKNIAASVNDTTDLSSKSKGSNPSGANTTAAAAVQNEAGGVGGKAGASMAGLVFMIGFAVFV
jgi:Phosphatidylethanolamine-binding protein